eukprot:CAMPEP_0194253880 /NCGR_PEP_ID=MMETSP0158-20130606/30852_1 /TAXON_ID=33649 /ORGANISM="Thalassionema nitzschioides, Strain L26-B" /LENGTH=557 /DNA_ID=CAMNT_0038991723 /DNA_START=41 /DNA_END=1711 /DNA_ORIENTATION=+
MTTASMTVVIAALLLLLLQKCDSLLSNHPTWTITRNSHNNKQAISSSSIKEQEASAAIQQSRSILSKLASLESTQTKLDLDQIKEYNIAIDGLPDPPPSLDVEGGWSLLATISPNAEEGNTVDFFDLESWKNYIAGSGPSPFQSLVTGSSRVQGLTQWLTPQDFDNLVEFNVGPISGKLVIKASLEKIENNRRTFRFRGGFFLLQTVWGGSIILPYPVPFALLGDRALGWLDTIGYDEETGFRAALGNKGTRFIFQSKEKQSSGSSSTLSSDVVTASELYTSDAQQETDEEERERNQGLTKRAVVICPQQFGGKPGDYTSLMSDIRNRGHPVYLARISALDWLSITKSVFTKEYFAGELEPSKTLGFYMDAIDKAVQRIPGGEETEFAILSHSIGGWIARAWLGEVASEQTRQRCKAYVSLGTPHAAPPPESIVSKADQTRGLLKYINDRWPGAYFSPSIQYTCVASSAVTGKVGLDLDNLLAFASYFALIGQGDVDGDGITPVGGALLDGAKSIVLDNNNGDNNPIYHADVLPNPLGGTNAKLIGTPWYADRMEEW